MKISVKIFAKNTFFPLLIFSVCVLAGDLRASSPPPDSLPFSTSIVHGELGVPSAGYAKSTVAVMGSELWSETVCSGSLIAEDLVVTAGHCDHSARAIRFGNFKSPTRVDRMITAKATEFSVLGFTNDITLLYFKGGLPPGYAPAELLPRREMLTSGAQLLLAGYGETSNDKGDTGTLRFGPALVDHLDSARGEVVVNEKDLSGACHGDSGGPAFLINGSQLLLFGVDSRSNFWGTCDHSEIYTDILDHLAWINDTAAKMRSGKIEE